MQAEGDVDGVWTLWCRVAENWQKGWAGKEGPRARGWLKAWRWLQDLSRAVTAPGPAAEAKVQLLYLLAVASPPPKPHSQAHFVRLNMRSQA